MGHESPKFMFKTAACPATDVRYSFEPPITVPHSEVPMGMAFNDVTDVFAALLVGKRGKERVAEMAHTILVMAHVAPNQEAFADYLTDLTEGRYRVTVA